MRIIITISFLICFANLALIGQKNFLIKSNEDFEISNRNKLNTKNANSVYVDIDHAILNNILTNTNTSFDTEIPLSRYDDPTNFLLTEFELLNDEFKVIDSKSHSIPYEKGKYFIAISKDKNGIGTFSFSKNSLIGILSYKNGDTYNVGKVNDRDEKYIVSRVDNLSDKVKFYCDTDDELDFSSDDLIESKYNRVFTGQKCIDLYAEADYALYLENGKSIKKTVDFVLGLFAETALLYKKEGVNIKISKIKIWNTPDHYNTDRSHTALNEFGSNNKDSDTDLNILLALGAEGLGGVAYINALCRKSLHFAYANIRNSFNNVPIYSWSAMVITHELGHNLGSRHTHSCNWNGDGSQIDDCGNVYFFNNGNTPEGNDCFDSENPILPAEGGTIMSYCHLVGGIGINLFAGFGMQPRDVINRRIASANCVDICESYGTIAPIAKFEPKREFTCVGGDLQFFDRSENSPNEWVWTMERKNGVDTFFHKFPIMTYKDKGIYDVSLISINKEGRDTIIKRNFISVIDGPKADFTYEFVTDKLIKFNNTSVNSTKYFWSFGDGGISLFKNPKHRYKEPGIYYIELKSTRDTCETSVYYTDSIEIKIPEIAIASYSNNDICIGETVRYKISNENYDSVKWVFEGGNINVSDKRNVNVQYDKAGIFGFKMIAFSKYGSDTLVKKNIINVKDKPVADFDYIINNDTLFLINKSLNSNEYLWKIGEKDSIYMENPVYIIPDSLNFVVYLKAINDCDSSVLAKQVIITSITPYERLNNSVIIFPNPSKEKFEIIFSNDNIDIKLITLTDLLGQIVFKEQIENKGVSSEEVLIRVNELKSGVYFLNILTKQYRISKRLIIERN